MSYVIVVLSVWNIILDIKTQWFLLGRLYYSIVPSSEMNGSVCMFVCLFVCLFVCPVCIKVLGE